MLQPVIARVLAGCRIEGPKALLARTAAVAVWATYRVAKHRAGRQAEDTACEQTAAIVVAVAAAVAATAPAAAASAGMTPTDVLHVGCRPIRIVGACLSRRRHHKYAGRKQCNGRDARDGSPCLPNQDFCP